MSKIDGDWLNGMLSTPLAQGALAALLVALVVLAVMRAGVVRRLLASIVALAIAAAAISVILDRQAQNERAAERHALTRRLTELSVAALAPGSALACLDGAAGEAVESACEKAIFGAPQATAGAVSYMAARLTLLDDGLGFAHSDPDLAATLSSLRRAVELDRFGLAAHVLAVRDGCTAESCAAFTWLHDTSVIKANLKAQVFDQYVSRYAADWNKSAPVASREAPPVPVASAGEQTAPAKAPVPDKYEFPSAASIPPVSIMNPEPPPPKEAKDAQAAQPPHAPPPPQAVPAPPKRPPAHAEPPPAAAPMPLR